MFKCVPDVQRRKDMKNKEFLHKKSVSSHPPCCKEKLLAYNGNTMLSVNYLYYVIISEFELYLQTLTLLVKTREK